MHVSIQTACVVIIPDVSYSRLKRNEVLLVFVIHFASDDIGNIHYCRNRGGKERKKLQQHGMYWVCGCLQNQSNGLLRWKSEVPGKYECLPSKSLRLLVGYEGSGVLMKEPLLRCHFTQLLGEKFFLERWRGIGGGQKMMLFSFPLQKPVWCWSWHVRILPHLLPFPHAWGKKHHSDHIKAWRFSVHPVRLQHCNSTCILAM